MVNLVKKFAMFALALSLAFAGVVPGYAAGTPSPTSGATTEAKEDTKPVSKSKITYQKGEYSTNNKGNAALTSERSGKKSVTINTIEYNGYKYKVTVIKAKAFQKSKATDVSLGSNVKTVNANAFKKSKVKTVKVGKKAPTFKKGAFKGSKVKTVKVKKSMTKKDFKKFVKALRKAGFKGKVKRC